MLLEILQIWVFFSFFDLCSWFSLKSFVISMISYNCLRSLRNKYRKILPKTIWDICYMLCLNAVCLLLLRILLSNTDNFMTQFLYSVMYVFWKKEKLSKINIIGVSIQAAYLPWVVFAFAKISCFWMISIVIGYSVGHFYYSLKYTLHEKYLMKVAQTPRWFKWLVLNLFGRILGFKNKYFQQSWEVSNSFPDFSFFIQNL